MRFNDLCDSTASGVLMSMDVFLIGYRKAQALADDKFALEKLALAQQWKHRFNFTEQLFKQENTVLVTTPQMRIVYASSNIINLSGYHPEEVIGQTPELFQGEKTATESKASIRQAIDRTIAFETSVINYRKNGSLYQCHIKGFPVFNRSKKLVNFIAFEKELAWAV